MNLGLEGRVALVGGGSRGLGRATAAALAAEGASVAIYARNRERLERVAAELSAEAGAEVVAIPADAGKPADLERAVGETVERFGGLDIVVPNMAGDHYPSDLLGESDATWEEEFELYTMSVIRVARAAIPHLRHRPSHAAIVNISTCGLHQLIPELALSEVVRLATAGFTKYLATELAPEGIRVNSILPGWIAGELIDELEQADADARGVKADAVRAESEAVIPMRRYGTAGDVGRAVAFLASDAASYITGVNLRVDGGWAMTPTG